ncbi:glutamine synthetase cytosolic isozyme 1-3-like [Brassica napus]|uniref:glutamine synthetase cytosolic isozyme 1-3-like n=1 Tax=Brassica napus TaxID=3708 RepID=UPI002078B849|nr:glutamine synthetase cytosolic isozyme 1-3-like [Brassica napus]
MTAYLSSIPHGDVFLAASQPVLFCNLSVVIIPITLSISLQGRLISTKKHFDLSLNRNVEVPTKTVEEPVVVTEQRKKSCPDRVCSSSFAVTEQSEAPVEGTSKEVVVKRQRKKMKKTGKKTQRSQRQQHSGDVDAYNAAGNPFQPTRGTNAAKIFSNSKVVSEEPWYWIEEEYTLMQKGVNWPIGGFPGPQGPYYCGVGADKAIDRDIMDAHYKACLYAGIGISGVNGEVTLGQWEFQVGPIEGISTGDQVWVARYLLERITEISGVNVSFDPKPSRVIVKHKENIAAYGEGNECRLTGKHEIAYINMFFWGVANRGASVRVEQRRISSDKEHDREASGEAQGEHCCWNNGGLAVIKNTIEKLQVKHKENIAAYGEGNERRLTGKHEAAYINTFSWGVANRGASVRVGRDTEKEGKGYFEDRRPASNMDPYVVTSMIAETTILG